jgi:hypothetical protein
MKRAVPSSIEVTSLFQISDSDAAFGGAGHSA